jgi:plasmid stability protein
MPTIQIRDVPEAVHRTLRMRAAAQGQSLQEYLLTELSEQARTRDLADVVAEARADITARPEAYSVISAVELIRRDRDAR